MEGVGDDDRSNDIEGVKVGATLGVENDTTSGVENADAVDETGVENDDRADVEDNTTLGVDNATEVGSETTVGLGVETNAEDDPKGEDELAGKVDNEPKKSSMNAMACSNEVNVTEIVIVNPLCRFRERGTATGGLFME